MTAEVSVTKNLIGSATAGAVLGGAGGAALGPVGAAIGAGVGTTLGLVGGIAKTFFEQNGQNQAATQQTDSRNSKIKALLTTATAATASAASLMQAYHSSDCNKMDYNFNCIALSAGIGASVTCLSYSLLEAIKSR